jgi:sigma-B regulation protein RsbU (phosphoserine phosphatase)
LQLIRTLPGRLLLISAGTLFALALVQLRVDLSPSLELLRKAVSLVALISAGWALLLLLARSRRQFLWRVRRKLLLSYLFLGVVPIVLVVAFALAGSVVFYDNLAAYLFRHGLADVVEDVHAIADAASVEIARNPANAETAAANIQANWAQQFPNLSLALIPTAQRAGAESTITAGPWRHSPLPLRVPDWVGASTDLAVVVPGPNRDDGGNGTGVALIIRAVVHTANGRRVLVADLPYDASVADRLRQRTGIQMDRLDMRGSNPSASQSPAAGQESSALAFRKTVTFLDLTDWTTGRTLTTSVHLTAPLLQLWQKLAAAQSAQLAPNVNRGLVLLLILIATLFAVIQGAALVMGGALARSITYAVHELFVGTERVQQGDFTHRIKIDSRDQLGDLAESFNRMSASMEHLLHVQREKQRLDDELRIAREIQRSLLPVRAPKMPGLSIADLCEPAREVGGDYYDFFELGSRQLGVLVADVSGKGTSAALYMAELKGLMLALSQAERSPRQLLRKVNYLLAAHLDNRSFITATYAVIDLDAMTLTYARAGHTPLILGSRGVPQVIVSDGMVLGLRLPGAAERFDAILEEQQQRLEPGDFIVMYTDGITEAMNTSGELFGDSTLTSVLAGAADRDASAIRERVVREVRAFVGDAEPHDDMTMVVIKVEPVSDAPAHHA